VSFRGLPTFVGWSINFCMSGVTFKAHFDGKHICPDEPCELPTNTQLVVAVFADAGETLDDWRAAWYALGQQSLARAYGDDEPDYSHCIGKTPPLE
jgi:hypothetical protein